MADESLTPPELDLARIAHRTAGDWTLEALADLAHLQGVGLPIGLVVSGQIVTGLLATPRAWAHDLDARLAALRPALDQGLRDAGATDDYREGVLESVTAGLFSNLVERSESRRREHDLKMAKQSEDMELSELDADLAREQLAMSQRPAITLVHADIAAPIGGPIHVGTMRVLLSQVGAWWLRDISEVDDRGDED